MFQQQKDWETRENAFAAFSMGPLTDFWRQREEAEFTGVDDIPVHFVRFHAEKTIASSSSVLDALKAT
ncbi:lysophospholipase L2 [Shigella flexneri 1235-66]|nr:lysophospholipase L2 [Citrobacter portucalensis]EIQ61225.1 lysophospholipase L2 [Shigella flexneri 1235-66]